MSEQIQPKNPKLLKKKAPVLTPEEQAVVLAEKAKADAEAKAERARVELYGKSVHKMSHRQLRGELVRTIKREHAGRPPVPQAGLTIGIASIMLAVLDNTKTVPDKHTRRDQINPWGKLDSYPR